MSVEGRLMSGAHVLNAVEEAPPQVRLRDLRILAPHQQTEFHDTLQRLMEHGIFILGEEVAEFERDLGNFVGRKHSVGVASASSGLVLALKALGIGPGDEVITTPMSWLMTTNAILMVGATPVFADVDEHFNLDPLAVGELISKKTRAILPVHYYGRIANMYPLRDLANMHDLFLVEDAAQAAGASRDGVQAGNFGDVGVFSFSPMKVLAALGDAGAVVFDDDALLPLLQSLRRCGTVDDEICVTPESKHTIDALQAAFLRHQMGHLSEVLETRRKFAHRYAQQLSGYVTSPDLGDGTDHTFYDFTILADRRDGLLDFLRGNGIEVKIRHPILISDQPVCADAKTGELGRATDMTARMLCLPMHNNLTTDDVDKVCQVIADFYGS